MIKALMLNIHRVFLLAKQTSFVSLSDHNGGKKARFAIGGGRNRTHADGSKLDQTLFSPLSDCAKGTMTMALMLNIDRVFLLETQGEEGLGQWAVFSRVGMRDLMVVWG